MAIDFTVQDTAGRPWILTDHLDSAVVLTFQRGDF
jgi:peroxiredoxin